MHYRSMMLASAAVALAAFKDLGAATAATADEATMRRSIQMKMFATDKQKAEVALAFQSTKDDLSTWQVPVGQIVGRVYAVNTRVFEVNGEPQERMYAVGEFEAVNYASGEVMESTAADLPAYYLEGIKGALDRNDGAEVLLGVEIVLAATGKAIAYAYEVRNLIPREANNPLNRIKAAIASKGKLRLPPPQAMQPIDAPEADDAPEPGSAG